MPETLQTNFAKEMAETHSEVARPSYFSHSHCWSRFALTWHRAQHQLLSWLELEKNAAVCCDITEQRRSSLPPVARCGIAANSFLLLPLDFQNEATLWMLCRDLICGRLEGWFRMFAPLSGWISATFGPQVYFYCFLATTQRLSPLNTRGVCVFCLVFTRGR